MQVDYGRVWPYLVAVLAVLVIYRRFRRSFGRQPMRPVRMGVRIAILAMLACSLLPAALKSGQFLASEVAGIVAGTALGMWGARHTRYLTYQGQLHYVPHTYTGVAVSLLFVGRLVYRLVELYSLRGASGRMARTEDFAAPSMVSSPFTVGLLFVVIGYYVCYYSMVLWRSKHPLSSEYE
ncbi:MAG: hypothetical protein M3O41_12065 [Pseudomonadota bacterium]|nr:hypothetical protein [Pseudomonadota bacterium]